MSARPALSLVLLTPQRMQRADVLADGSLLAPVEWSRERPVGTDLADHAELALRLGGAPGKLLWVLASELWTQTASLPAGAARASSPSELAQALALEVEALSGLASQDALVGLQALEEREGEARFWVTLAPLYLVEDLAAVAERAGARLGGVCHPGGLPGPLQPGPGPWERIELWDEALFDLRWEGGQLSLEVEPGGALAHLPAPGPERRQELLVAEGLLAPEGVPEGVSCELGDPAARARWLGAWGAALLAGGAGVPQILPPRRPLSRSARLLTGVSLLCLSVLGCAGHYAWAQGEIQRLKAQLEAAAAPAQAAAQLEQRAAQLGQERDRLLAETARLAQVEARYRELTRVHRGRHGRLLRALAQAPAEVWVESLSDRGQSLRIEGLAADPQVALALATSLARDLQGSSWRVAAPEVGQDLVQGAGQAGGGWRFRLELIDQPLPRAAGGTK